MYVFVKPFPAANDPEPITLSFESFKDQSSVPLVLGITPIIVTGKEIGQFIKGEDLVTGQKYGPEDYVWGTLAVVSGGTTRVVGKVFGKAADLEKKGKALEAAAKNTKFTKYPTGFDEVAQALGWDRKKGNHHEVAPGKNIGGNVYYNNERLLPSAPNRT